VHEAYLRLVGAKLPPSESRTHFFAIAAQLMRQILVDYARRYRAAKRGAGWEHYLQGTRRRSRSARVWNPDFIH